MIDCERILAIANREMEGTDLFVVGCKCNPMNEVELLVDSDTAVSIEQCIALSRKIEAEFDRDVEDFSLTVASAGIGEELKNIRQYRKLVGSSVEVPQSPERDYLIGFVRNSKRGVIKPYVKRAASAE